MKQQGKGKEGQAELKHKGDHKRTDRQEISQLNDPAADMATTGFGKLPVDQPITLLLCLPPDDVRREQRVYCQPHEAVETRAGTEHKRGTGDEKICTRVFRDHVRHSLKRQQALSLPGTTLRGTMAKTVIKTHPRSPNG